MSELIDRQALRAAHGLGADCHDCKRDMKSCQYDRDYSLMDFCEWLDDAPAIDAVPVVHGAWIFNPADGIEAMFTKPKCSLCGFESSDGLNYCPNCGARMGEGREG